MKNCCAIVITFNPKFTVFKKALVVALNQVDRVYVIDNGSKEPLYEFLENRNNVEAIFLRKNRGVATGFNVGIKLARKAGYEYALLLDQDSILSEGMIGRYLEVMQHLSTGDERVGALGPRYRNQRMRHTSRFVRFHWFHISYCGSHHGPPVVETDFVISSGSFYDLSVFDEVGMFNEGLFVDHVDTEWCQRATSLGFKFFGIWDVVMEHALGEGGISVWLFRRRVHPIHKPFRLYFIMRNSLLMYRMPHVSKKWMSADILRLLRLSLVYILFTSHRNEAIEWLVKGFLDGIKGITGGGRVFS